MDPGVIEIQIIHAGDVIVENSQNDGSSLPWRIRRDESSDGSIKIVNWKIVRRQYYTDFELNLIYLLFLLERRCE